MIPGTTPTFTMRAQKKDGTLNDLSDASEVYMTMKQPGVDLTISGDNLDVDESVVSVFLTQEQSLQFKDNSKAKVMLNWTYPPDAKGRARRGAAGPGYLTITEQLLRRVLP